MVVHNILIVVKIYGGKNIWSTAKETIEALLIADHEEAEMSNEAAVIAAKNKECFYM